jgi:hypothetical protein
MMGLRWLRVTRDVTTSSREFSARSRQIFEGVDYMSAWQWVGPRLSHGFEAYDLPAFPLQDLGDRPLEQFAVRG